MQMKELEYFLKNVHNERNNPVAVQLIIVSPISKPSCPFIEPFSMLRVIQGPNTDLLNIQVSESWLSVAEKLAYSNSQVA